MEPFCGSHKVLCFKAVHSSTILNTRIAWLLRGCQFQIRQYTQLQTLASFRSLVALYKAPPAAGNTPTKAEVSRRLQPYTDHLVYSAVIALPWLAPELQHLESDPEGLVTFSDAVEQYLALRPNSSSQDALNPFTLAASAEDALSLGGSGSTSFLPEVRVALLANSCMACLTVAVQTLPAKDSLQRLHASICPPCCQAARLTVFLQLWACIKELKDNQWKLISVASYSDSFEAQLAACKPLELVQLTVPLQPPGIAADLPLPQVGWKDLLCFIMPKAFPLCTSCWCCSCTACQGLIDRLAQPNQARAQ